MKIYTRTGDGGETGLFGGVRVAKDALRVHAYGTVDECNAAIGIARASLSLPDIDAILEQTQNQLFVVGADLATPGEAGYIPRIADADIAAIEQTIDALEAGLEPLKTFILPGGTLAGAQLHLARTICRRAERWTVSLAREEPINPAISPYLNRLSDLLFVISRAANAGAGIADVPWVKVS